MRRNAGFTEVECTGALFVGIALIAVLVAQVLPACQRDRESARRIRCRNNLHALEMGMATYLNQCGDNRFYPWPAGRAGCGTVANPQFGGAEWLASLYWTRVIPAPCIFICPSSPDTNENGALLGPNGCPGGKPLSPQAVSYAALGDTSAGIYLAFKLGKGGSYATSKLAVRDDFPPDEPMACDDTQGPINHGEEDNGGMNVLFFDSHVEFWTHAKVNLTRGVGTGELVHLRN